MPLTSASSMPVAIDTMTAADFRALAKSKLDFSAEEHDGDFNQDASIRDWVMGGQKRPAAVLVGIVEREGGLNMILTKRTEQLKSHSGQVAFPGGKIDAGDEDEFAAAIREGGEEIALETRDVEILGRLPDYYSGSGYRIAPVIALVNPKAQFTPNPGEVEYVFEVPLSFLMDPANHVRSSREWNGHRRHFLEMPWQGHYIWGVTAGIIRALYERMFA